MLVPGMLVDRYELVSPVGEGGMAQVWIARQKGKHGFEKLFAFKCIHTRFADHPAFRSMFLDEARIAASIEHPNVAQVYDLGESDSMLYLVMEYVDGESLGALMNASARRANETVPVPISVALRIIADALAGLHAAHKLTDAQGNLRGVVHRDISPQNILVSVRGDVKVIDFGIALAKDRLGSDTDAGSLKGKLHYMAPEQALREPIGPYTDVYAMGATLYRLLAGRPPHDGGNDAATLHLLLGGTPPAPLPDSVPPLIAAIIARAIERDPGDRYSSALAMQTALEAAMVEEGYVSDVATWVTSTLSDNAKQRRAQLATRTINISPESLTAPPTPASKQKPSFDAELIVPDLPVAASAPPVSPRPNPLAKTPAPAPAKLPASAPSLAAAPDLMPSPPPRPPPRPPPAPPPPPPVPAVIALADDPPPSSRPEHSAGPGMLDVRALVARVSSPASVVPFPDAPPPSSGRPGDDRAPPSGRDGESVAQAADGSRHEKKAAPRHVGPATKAAPESAGARGSTPIKIAVGAIVVVLVLAVGLLFLPRIVHDRIVASAAESGIELTIERVGIGLSGITLKNVTARAARVPGGDFRADEIFATGFSARDVRVRGAELKLDGHASVVGPAVLAFYDANRAKLAGGSEARRVSIVGAHVVWTGIVGPETRLDAGEVGSEIESRSVGSEDIRATVARYEVKLTHTTIGPWSGSFERSPATSRLRILFDPPVPDGPSALVVWGKGLTPKLTLRVPRSPLARLGVKPEELGIPGDASTEVEVKLEVGQSPTMRWEANGRLDAYGVRLKGLKSPIDVTINGGGSGLPGKPLDLEKTTATIGPFVANVTGAVTWTDFGFRLDASWRTQSIPCVQLARAEAKSMGPIAAALQDIAHTTGAARVTGNAHASGVVKYDTKTPDEGSMTMLTHEACGLSIFGL